MGTCPRLHVAKPQRNSVALATSHIPPRVPFLPDDICRFAVAGAVPHLLCKTADVGGVQQGSIVDCLPEGTEKSPAFHLQGRNLQEPRIGSMKRDWPMSAFNELAVEGVRGLVMHP